MDPPLSLLKAHDALTKVAEALEAGDRDCARQALRQIDRVAAHHYYSECGVEGVRRQKENPPDRPEGVTRLEISDETRRRIGSRDGWRCRYCGLPVADRVFFRKLRSALPEEFPPSPAPIEGTAWTIDRVFSAKPDHIVPVSAGGTTTEENLVTACGACNDQAKGDALLSQLGITTPDLNEPVMNPWSGLVGRPSSLA